MSLIVSEKSNYTPAPEGLHRAVCTGVIDLGTQQTPYGSKPQLLILWELDALMDDGRPFSLSRRFSPSLGKKATLRTFLESWRGRAFTKEELSGFEMKNILNKPCQLMVKHSPSADGSRIYANITAAVPAPKGTALTPQGGPLYFDQDDPDASILEQLPEWIRKLVDSAVKPVEMVNPYAAEPSRDFDQELSF